MDVKVYRGALDNIERGQAKSLKEKVESHPEMLGFFMGTLLEKSLVSGQTEILRYLLAQAAVHNVAVNQSKLDTLLNSAATGGQFEAVESFLEAGANINKEGQNGNTVLSNSISSSLAAYSHASREKQEKMFFYLISRGAKVGKPYQLLTTASLFGYTNVARYLLDEVIDQYPVGDADRAKVVKIGEWSNGSALLCAIRGNHLDVVKLLLERGGAMGGGGEDGRAALKEAEAGKKTEIIKALLEAGVALSGAPEDTTGIDSESVSDKTEAIMNILQGFSGQQPAVDGLDVKPGHRSKAIEDATNLIAKMMSGEIFDDIKQRRDEWIAEHIARGRCLERETRPLNEVLRELEIEFLKLDPRLPQLFNPGLSEHEFDSLTQGEDWAAGELADLYRWHNGCRNYEARGLFGPYFFFPLQDALKMRTGMAGISPHYCLPIMDDGAGGWIEADLRPDADQKGLLYELYKEQQDSPEIFPGLNAYFGAYLACFRQAAFRVVPKAGQNGEDLLVGDYQLIDATVARYRLRLSGDIIGPVAAPTIKDDEGDGISIKDYTVALPSSL